MIGYCRICDVDRRFARSNDGFECEVCGEVASEFYMSNPAYQDAQRELIRMTKPREDGFFDEAEFETRGQPHKDLRRFGFK